MSNIQTGAERMPHDLSHLGFLAGQIGRLITISTTPVIAGDSFEMDAVGALRLSPLRRGLAIDSTVDIFTFYVPHRHVYGEQWIKFRMVLMPLLSRLLTLLVILTMPLFLARLTLIPIKSLSICFRVILISIKTILKRRGCLTVPRLNLISFIKMSIGQGFVDCGATNSDL